MSEIEKLQKEEDEVLKRIEMSPLKNFIAQQEAQFCHTCKCFPCICSGI